jgi:hypothetical protein
MGLRGSRVDRPSGLFSGADRPELYARSMLPPLENRDPGDETSEDD